VNTETTSRIRNFGGLIRPTAPGQVVRILGYGGRVALHHVGQVGTVVRFTPAGNPVIDINGQQVHDTYGCARRILPSGKWMREEV
jgi:hypothetical protein